MTQNSLVKKADINAQGLWRSKANS